MQWNRTSSKELTIPAEITSVAKLHILYWVEQGRRDDLQLGISIFAKFDSKLNVTSPVSCTESSCLPDETRSQTLNFFFR